MPSDAGRLHPSMVSASLRCAVALACALCCIACTGEQEVEKVQLSAHDEAAALGDVEIRVDKLEILRPDLVDADQTSAVIKAGVDRVLAVTLTFKNVGEAAVTYRPAHRANSTAGTRPLLWRLEGESKPPAVPPVAIGGSFFMIGQQTSNVPLAKGESVTDIYIYEIPQGEELMLTVPATIFGGSPEEMARFKLPNQPRSVPDVKPAAIGEAYTKGGVEVKVTAVEDSWVEAVKTVSDVKDDEKPLKYPYAYTAEPVLRVALQVTNKSKETRYYDPGHRGSDSRGVQLDVVQPTARTLDRIKLANPEAAAKGQQTAAVAIEPGKSLNDVFLFERPMTSGKASLRLAISGHVLGTAGLFEFALEYSRDEPPEPDWVPWKKEKKEEEEGDK